jgi:deoxycytidylate deaminase
MTSYIKEAINAIYGEEDDCLILGLTGRTGSGCSTVAKLLQEKKENLTNSLYFGDSPASNDERKQKIVHKHFMATWEQFKLIQVRSVITLMLAESSVNDVLNLLSPLSDGKTTGKFKTKLSQLKSQYKLVKKNGISSEIGLFYTERLPKKCEEIKTILGESAFVKLYQIVGSNIRVSGDPCNGNAVHGQFFALAERINSIVLEIRAANRILRVKTLIVIDAIRNPFEAIYFQDRYPSFHLVAVSCSEMERRKRLRALKFSETEIDSIDAKEYVARDLDEDSTYSIQNIQACLERADIYISNPDESNHVSEFKNLANQLIRLVSLMKRPGIITPTPLERCMQIAYTAKLNSGCISRQVGAVVTDKDFSVSAIGWNDTPYGQVPCNLRNRSDLLHGVDEQAYSNFEKNDIGFIEHFRGSSKKYISIELDGRNISYCFKSEYNAHKKVKNQVHTRSLHAEENAFLQISKYGGQGIKGGNLFTTASPCELCAKKAYQLGIKNIYYIDPYPGIAITHIIEGGTNNPIMTLFSGAIGRAFHKLYSPIMAYKDELDALSLR